MSRRKGAPFDLTRRGVVAFSAGQRMAKYYSGDYDWLRANPRILRGYLLASEMEAFDALLPATWWASFTRGWNSTVAASQP